eukprot:jgi/Psemu1/313232/fgenesh1_kg.1128_\
MVFVVLMASVSVNLFLPVRPNLWQTQSQQKDADIAVLVMGEAEQFSMWLHRLEQIKNKQLTFIYASYDRDIAPDDDGFVYTGSLKYDTIFIPGTAWTDGRDALGEKAIEAEVRRKKTFDYWVFSDDDATVKCESLSEAECWQHVFDYIGRDDMPSQVSTVAFVVDDFSGAKMHAVSNADAYFNAFKRDYVPYMQPYVSMPAGTSSWVSQLAVFCIMQKCLPGSVFIIPEIHSINLLHRPYVRGLNFDELKTVLALNYGGRFDWCAADFAANTDLYEQGYGSTPLVDTLEELKEVIPPASEELELPDCSFLKDRFEKWESGVKKRMYQ